MIKYLSRRLSIISSKNNHAEPSRNTDGYFIPHRAVERQEAEITKNRNDISQKKKNVNSVQFQRKNYRDNHKTVQETWNLMKKVKRNKLCNNCLPGHFSSNCYKKD